MQLLNGGGKILDGSTRWAGGTSSTLRSSRTNSASRTLRASWSYRTSRTVGTCRTNGASGSCRVYRTSRTVGTRRTNCTTGHRADARPLWEKVAKMAADAKDAKTQATAQARLAEKD